MPRFSLYPTPVLNDRNAWSGMSFAVHFAMLNGGIGAGDGQFMEPVGIAVDGQGRVYVADTGNNRIRLIGHDGRITTVAGTGAGSSGGDAGPAAAAAPSAAPSCTAATSPPAPSLIAARCARSWSSRCWSPW